MASNEHKEGFEIFLKEKADSYKMYPSEKIWADLHNQLHPRKKWPYLVMAVVFLGLGFGGKIYDSRYNSQNPEQSNASRLPGHSGVTATQNAHEDPQALVIDLYPSSKNIKPSSKGITRQQHDKVVTSSIEKGTRIYTSPLESIDGENNIKEKISSPDWAMKNPLPLRIVLENERVNVTRSEVQQEGKAFLTNENSAGNHNTDQGKLTSTDKKGKVAAKEPELLAANRSQANDLNAGKPVMQRQTGGKPSTVGKLNADLLHEVAFSSMTNKNTSAQHTKAIKVKKPGQNRLGWQLYLSPMVSYRNLYGTVNKNSYSNLMMFSNLPGRPHDVNSAVSQSPSVGMELGTAMVYKLSNRIKLKGGLQFNYSQYNIGAFNYSEEIVPVSAAGIGHTEIKAISFHRNFDGYSEAELKNEHFSISMPLGVELVVLGNKDVAFNIGGSLQPGLMLNNQAYMLSTNLKNYAKVPSLYRDFNINTAIEAFITIKRGTLSWNVGPQFRYQLLSSYKQNYPIKEHLYDYGFKVGMTKILR